MKLLGSLMLLLMSATCISGNDPANTPASDVQRMELPQAIEGFNLLELYSSNRDQAAAAYKDCVQHGSACQIPCSSIKHCVGCHPDSIGGNAPAAATVCAYFLPGFKLSQDRTSCQACPLGSTSKGGRAATCESCPEGLTTLQEGSDKCLRAPKRTSGRPGNPADANIPSGARVPAPAGCTLPVPESVFANTCGGTCKTVPSSGPCKEGTTGDVVTDGELCDFSCYDGATGQTQVTCENGIWAEFSNSCSLNKQCDPACKQSGVWPAYCNPASGQCECPAAPVTFGEPERPTFTYLNGYGCVTDLTSRHTLPPIGYKRCYVRTQKGGLEHVDACASSDVYSHESTKCTQVSVITAPIRSTCPTAKCTADKSPGGCWVQIWSGGAANASSTSRIPSWIQSGPDCVKDPYGYLTPCPTTECRQAPSSEVCKVEASAGLIMRVAPCLDAAPVKQADGLDTTIPAGDTFQYLDRNSRQASDCIGYNYFGSSELQARLSYCWVLGSYKGVSGWVPVQSITFLGGFSSGWTSALCTYFKNTPTLLVSDDESATGCAQLTKDSAGLVECFPADATVYLRNGSTASMHALELGDEVAVRNPDGSIGYEAVYAFGHRDDHTAATFVEVVVTQGFAQSFSDCSRPGAHTNVVCRLCLINVSFTTTVFDTHTESWATEPAVLEASTVPALHPATSARNGHPGYVIQLRGKN